MSDATKISSEPPKHGALLHLFAKIERDPITVHEALEDIRRRRGEHPQGRIDGLETRMDARFDTIQREISSMRWMIGIGSPCSAFSSPPPRSFTANWD